MSPVLKHYGAGSAGVSRDGHRWTQMNADQDLQDERIIRACTGMILSSDERPMQPQHRQATERGEYEHLPAKARAGRLPLMKDIPPDQYLSKNHRGIQAGLLD